MKEAALHIGKGITKFLEFFYISPIRNYINRETYLYATTGGLNTVLDIFLYFLIYNFSLHKEILDFGFVAISPHIAAFLLVFPITFSTGFFFAKFVTFTQSRLKGRKQLFRYAVSVSGSILLNYLLLKLFVEYMGLYATLSKMITTVIVVIYSFIIQKFFTFKTGKHQIKKAGL